MIVVIIYLKKKHILYGSSLFGFTSKVEFYIKTSLIWCLKSLMFNVSIRCFVRSNSLSNVSSSLSQYLHDLVRAFSSRTEKIKENTIQPPTPSSLSEVDALSEANSGTGSDNIVLSVRNTKMFSVKYLRLSL